MNRTQRQHGARAGWHAAKIAAHQYTPTKRKPLAPVGQQSVNDAARLRLGDRACDACGYAVHAPTCVNAGYVAPAKALGVLAVGRKVKCVSVVNTFGCLTLGKAYSIDGLDNYARECVVVTDDHGVCGSFNRDRFEPVPDLPASAADGPPAEWTPPAPWSLDTRFGCGAFSISTTSRGLLHAWPDENVFAYSGAHGKRVPTLAQACCAALGITLVRERGSGSWVADGLVGDTHRVIVGYESAHYGIETCARAALHAFHAGGGRAQGGDAFLVALRPTGPGL